jgi:predicted GNAT family acetyltransferase
MEIVHFNNVGDFYQRTEAFLMEREAEHNLTLGICSELKHDSQYSVNPYMVSIEDDGKVIGTAVCTPPHKLILSHMDSAEPLEALVRDVCQFLPDLSGVIAPVNLAVNFAEQWTFMTGHTHRLEIAERIYQLDTVLPISPASGQMRRITEADRALLCDWLVAFEIEVLPGHVGTNPDLVIERALKTESRGMFLWEDLEPVTLVGYAGPTLHGIRIGPVYTPPEFRRKGYASTCVAAVSQQLLKSGREFCFLYTDLTNPTSNRIYQHIGYKPVSDVDMYQFKR